MSLDLRDGSRWEATVRLMVGDLSATAAAGPLSRRPDDFEVRMYREVGDACLEELAELHLRTDRAVRQAILEGHERVARSGGAGTEVVTALFFFEAPLWRDVVAKS